MSENTRDYSWAEYLDCMEGGGGSDVLSLPTPVSKSAGTGQNQPIWGVLAAVGVTLVALWLAKLNCWPFTVLMAGRATHPVEPVMIAIILGMIIGNAWHLPKALQPGLKFSVKKVLPLAIILLGARLHFGDLMKVGLTGLGLAALETVVALALLWILARWMRLPNKLGALLGVGTAICGGTAIVAVAPAIEAEEKDVAFSVATVTLLGLAGMFALPFLGHLLNLSSKQFGMWAGLAIHQTPQVIAAGYAYWPRNTDYSPVAGDTATIVKLARVCLLAPVVFVLGLMYARRKVARTGDGARKINYLRLFPTFILGFVGMALLKTCGLIPEVSVRNAAFLTSGVHSLSLAAAADQVSRFCIVVSMAGMGLETKFAAMRQTGLKPFVASLIAVIIVAVMVLTLIKALGI
jgi:uncharacterized integral membrane protein (TIGR00698 family)